jgi:hypothetical protein
MSDCSSPYSWLSNKSYDTIKINDLFKYDPNIESYKNSFSHNLPEYSSSVYTDEISIEQMVCNQRYIFVLVKYSEQHQHQVLFVIDTTCKLDDCKMFDSDIIADKTAECFNCNCTRFNPCDECKELGKVFKPTWGCDYTAREIKAITDAKNRPSIVPSCFLYTNGPFKLYCVQNSNESECVVISDNYIYLYKDCILNTHEYMYTIRDVQIHPGIVKFFDEYNVCYTFTYSNDPPMVEKVKSRVEKTYHDYTLYNTTRLDSKGDRYRLTNTDSDIPKYMYLPDVYVSKNYLSRVCISDNLCVVQTCKASIQYFKSQK